MSIVTLFTSKAPTIGALEFDAVLEDTFEASVEVPTYTIEAGAQVSDHRIIQPLRWSLIGAMSNNPLRLGAGDFVGALSNLADDSGLLAAVTGISAGLLAGSSQTRSSAALEELILLMVSGDPFDVSAGDIDLSNMVITDIRRVKNPTNENGLIFEAQLQELPTLETVTLTLLQPKQNQLRDGDPAKSQASAVIDKGEIGPQPLTDAQISQLTEFSS